MPPARLQLPNMRQWGLLPFLVPLIFLWSVQEPELAEGFFFKVCPKIRVKCEVEERNQCTRNRHCPDKHKCCMFACGKKCLDLRADICSMPEDPGPCLAYIPRWWYNQDTELCSEFIYAGCQGNANNFQSKAICTVVCKKNTYLPGYDKEEQEEPLDVAANGQHPPCVPDVAPDGRRPPHGLDQSSGLATIS